MVALKFEKDAAKCMNLELQANFVTIYATVLQPLSVLVTDRVEFWLQQNFSSYNSAIFATIEKRWQI